MALPDFLRDILRGGLPEVLDIPVAAQDPVFTRGPSADPFPEQYGPVDSAPLSTIPGTGFPASRTNVLIAGGLAVTAVVVAAVALSR